MVVEESGGRGRSRKEGNRGGFIPRDGVLRLGRKSRVGVAEVRWTPRSSATAPLCSWLLRRAEGLLQTAHLEQSPCGGAPAHGHDHLGEASRTPVCIFVKCKPNEPRQPSRDWSILRRNEAPRSRTRFRYPRTVFRLVTISARRAPSRETTKPPTMRRLTRPSTSPRAPPVRHPFRTFFRQRALGTFLFFLHDSHARRID